jgi:hypothetical protein
MTEEEGQVTSTPSSGWLTLDLAAKASRTFCDLCCFNSAFVQASSDKPEHLNRCTHKHQSSRLLHFRYDVAHYNQNLI